MKASTTKPVAYPRLLLVDGHAYAYRAWHAIRDLRGPDGRPTNAIFGFIKAFEKLLHNVEPTHAAVLWDGGLDAERVEVLPEYKAQRPEIPEGLRIQLNPIATWLQARGVATGCRPGVEADDWIATLAHWAQGRGWEVLIASSDKDFMQLVSAAIGLIQPHDPTAQIWTEQQVRTKTGVTPAQVVDWLSLVGDVSDNIPGVPGVGPKTAAKLLNRFGSMEGLMHRLAEVEPARIREALRQSADQIRRNQSIIRLRTDLPLGLEPTELALRPPNTESLRTLYQQWGFRSLLQGLPNDTPISEQADLFIEVCAGRCQSGPAGQGEKLDNVRIDC
ncbi:MAG: 5'-3' exonuclease H3TH domain-containing protein [Verrucomicrobiota bacterium]|nr:flap endonuclease [Limisphaera sp.]MDW8381399.1 5'-3' exonuclease H3TH domain-containing protein [Verrucomicrobiota bacterium]